MYYSDFTYRVCKNLNAKFRCQKVKPIKKCGWEERPPKWRVAANILNKQSQTADKEWSSSWEVGQGADKSSP
jgi:hypothetical protein